MLLMLALAAPLAGGHGEREVACYEWMGWAEVLWAVVEVEVHGFWERRSWKKWSSMTSVPVAFFLLSSPLVVHVAGKSAPDNVF